MLLFAIISFIDFDMKIKDLDTATCEVIDVKSGKCLECKEKYFLKPNGECESCSGGCTKCVDESHCNTCISSLLLLDGACVLHQTCDTLLDHFIYSNVDGSFECKSCSSHEKGNCSACTSTSCTKCTEGYYLYNGGCINECPSQTYPDDETQMCSYCGYKECDKCISPDTCRVCKPDYFVQNGKCVNSCDQGYFQEIPKPSGTCAKCPNSLGSCKTCTSKDVCTECNNSQYLQGNECVNICGYDDGYYVSISGNEHGNKCELCSNSIKNCGKCKNKKTCDFCSNGYYLYEGKCLETCPSGSYKVEPTGKNGGQCIKCDISNCMECEKDACLICKNNYYLYKNKCISTCPDTTYPNEPINGKGGECIECSEIDNCLKCSGKNNCTLCDNNLLIHNGGCVETCGDYQSIIYDEVTHQLHCIDCPYNCFKCSSALNCTTCGNNFILKDGWCVELSECTGDWIMTTYPDENFQGGQCTQCKNLLPHCETCESTSKCTKCINDEGWMQDGICVTECLTGFYNDTVNGIPLCIECPQGNLGNCNQCEKIGDEIQCVECKENKYLLNSKICVDRCEDDQFISNKPNDNGIGGTCKNCHEVMPFCTKCDSDSVCLKCNSSNYLEGNQCKSCSSSIPGCSSCNSGKSCLDCDYERHYYMNPATGICEMCNSTIEGCDYCHNGTTCEVCQQHYLKNNGLCIDCQTISDGCLECKNSNTCTKCDRDNGFYIDKDGDKTICKKCSSLELGINCNTCSNSSFCEQCTNGYYLQGKVCVKTCDITYYESTSGKSEGNECTFCKSKLNSCYSCINNQTCTVCDSYYFLHTDGKCLPKCNEYHYQIQKPDEKGMGGNCSLCSSAIPNCLKCDTADNCKVCNNNKVLQNGECKKSCEMGYYESNKGNKGIGRKCSPCPASLGHCRKCSNAKVCQECNSSQYLKNNICVDKVKCDSHFYISKEPNNNGIGGKCSSCDSASKKIGKCSECHLDTKEVCDVCKEGWKLHGTLCKKVCDKGWWDEGGSKKIGGYCTQCSDNTTIITKNCTSCESSSKCKECKDHSFLKEISGEITTCVENCGDEYYVIDQGKNGVGAKCDKCPERIGECKVCEKDAKNSVKCHLCKPNNYLLNSIECKSECPEGTYTSVESTEYEGGQCEYCIDNINNCNRCDNSTHCTRCINSKSLYDGKCLDSCPIGYYQDFTNVGTEGIVCTKCPKDGVLKDCYDCVDHDICSACENNAYLTFPYCGESCNKSLGYIVSQEPNLDGKDGMCIHCSIVNNGNLGKCNLCDNSTSCTECMENQYLQENVCVLKCNETYYASKEHDSGGYGGECSLCPHNDQIGQCYSCKNESSCTKCEINQYLQGEICVETCDIGWYISAQPNDKGIGGECTKCTESPSKLGNCIQCSDNETCSECSGNEYLEENKCVSKCSDNYYVSVEPNEKGIGGNCTICSDVITNCNKCDGNTKCFICQNGWYLQVDKCVETCDNGWYIYKDSDKDKTGGVCGNCSEHEDYFGKCNKCASATKCIECKDDQYLEDDKCISKCSNNHHTLIEPNEEGIGGKCTSCKNSITNCDTCKNPEICTICDEHWYLQGEICVEICDKGWYISAQPNDKGIGGECTKCTESPSKLGNCIQCSDNETCSECSGNEYLEDDKCVSKCSDNYYVSVEPNEKGIGGKCTSSCKNSITNCDTCKNPEICIICDEHWYLQGEICVETCDKGWYISAQPNDKGIGGECTLCNSSLIDCISCENSDICTKCDNGKYLTADFKCEERCNDGYYKGDATDDGTGQQCKLCADSIAFCEQCKSSKECTVCNNGMLLQDGKCVDKCSETHYQEKGRNILECVLCNSVIPDCIECISSTQCIICGEDKVQLNGECIDECPYGYKKNIQNICIEENEIEKPDDDGTIPDGTINNNVLIVYRKNLDDGSKEGIPLKHRGEITWVDTNYTNVTIIGRNTPRSEFYIKSNQDVTIYTIDSENDTTYYHDAIFGIRPTEKTTIVKVDKEKVPLYVFSDSPVSEININTNQEELFIDGKVTVSNSDLTIKVQSSESTEIEVINISKIVIYEKSSLKTDANKIYVDDIETKRGAIGTVTNIKVDKSITVNSGSTIVMEGEYSAIESKVDMVIKYDSSSNIRTPAIMLDDGIDLPERPNSLTITQNDPTEHNGNNPEWKIVCGPNFTSCEKWISLFGATTNPYGTAECRNYTVENQICLVAIEADGNNDQKYLNEETASEFPFLILGVVAGILVLSTTSYVIWRYVVIWKNKEGSTSDSVLDESPPETAMDGSQMQTNNESNNEAYDDFMP